jgi:ParB/RepB/Spo0J family partition protein
VQPEGELRQVPIESIRLSPFNARRALDGKSLTELSSSIEQQGLIEPIILRPKGRTYEVIAGTRRFLAAKKAGMKAITAAQERTYALLLGLELMSARATELRVVRIDLAAVRTCCRQ